MCAFVYACFLANEIGEGYEDYKILDQIGVFTTQKGAYNALVKWVQFVFHHGKIESDETRLWVFVDGRKYFVSSIEFHDE